MKSSAIAVAFAIVLAPACVSASNAIVSPVLQRADGVTIVTQNDPHGRLIGLEYVVRAGLDRQTMGQSGLAALTAQSIMRSPVTVDGGTMPLDEAIADHGGSVHYTVDPHDVRFYVQMLQTDAPAVLGFFSAALRSPDFSAQTVDSARAEVGAQIARRQQMALQVGLDMLDRADAKAANAGLPALGNVASLAQIVPSEVAAFYAAYYRRGGSVASAAGNLAGLAPSALNQVADALPVGSSKAVAVHVARLRGVTRQLIAHRDVASPWLIAQYPAPNAASKDFGPMLVLSAFVQRTLADIAGIPGVVSQTFASRAAGAVYAFDRKPARLVLYVNGAIGNPSRTFATALSVVGILSQTKLKGSIGEFKAVAAGNFAIGATDLESRAWLAAVFASENLSPDFLDRALQAIASTTPQDVQRVARRYMGNPTIALVLPRDGRPLGQ